MSMLKTKSFIKKNKFGNYLKIVREHYLRDDIFCGLEDCNKCKHSPSNLTLQHKNVSSLYKFNHYLIPDTNVILHQIDVFDESEGIIANVIILNTVLQEVRHRSLPIYKRLSSIIDNQSRHFYIFVNDHHKDCYLDQEPQETANDYNDRSIRQTVQWYQNHIPNQHFVLLTDDAENRRFAEKMGLKTTTISDYVLSLDNSNCLADKLARKDFHVETNIEDLFPPHLSPAEINSGIKNGTLYQGVYHASRENFLEGFVSVESIEESVIVQGRSGQNRAVEGDLVAVQLLKKNKWVALSELVIEDEGSVEAGVEEVLLKEKELAKATAKKAKDEIKPTGKVVGVIRRKWRQYCGILQKDGSETSTIQLFVPSDQRIPKIRIETRQFAFLKTQKIIVGIDSWPRHSRYPNGHYVRALGAIGDQSTENEVVLIEHDVPHSQFSEEVLGCLPKLPWLITEEDEKNRVDLRHIDICSVDPPGCTDIDDALHCRRLENDKYEVGVHIADVSHFIRPGNALDKEAQNRATTVYLVNKRIDMVPELLSSNLCSLRGGVERFAFSCIWEMDKKANILNTRFHKSIIKSKKAMTYEEAQTMIDDDNLNDSIAQSLRGLNKLAKILKRRRLQKGALVLASPEVKIHMDSETMDPIDVEVKKLFETNSMVEEFMLLANISVAQQILQAFPECAMLRRHPEPPSINFDPLIKAGEHLGFDIKIDTGKNLAISLDAAVKEDNPYLNTLLRILATRCMLQAVYFPSGVYQSEEFFHYGLAVPLYTHFTSPIRRYADIIVHRLLAVSVNADVTYPDLLDKHKTAEICKNLNYRNRMAQQAGRSSVNFNTFLFFRGKLEDEKGYILYVRKNAIQVIIPKYGLEANLFLAKKGEQSSHFIYDEEKQTQRSGNIVLHAFDPVLVRLSLDSQNIQHERIMLELVEPYIEGFSVSPLSLTKRKNEDDDATLKKKKLKKKKKE